MKKVNVFHRKDTKSNVYYASYRTKVNDPVRGVIVMQRTISTHQTNRLLAQKRAEELASRDREEFRSGIVKTDRQATCGEVIDLYLKNSRLISKQEVVIDFTYLVAEGLGKLNLGYQERLNFVRAVRICDLSADQLKGFRAQIIRLRCGAPPLSANNIRSIMSSGKSIFGRNTLNFYGWKKLPDNIQEWMKVPNPPWPRGEDKSYQPIGPKLLEMDKFARSAMLRLSRWHGRLGYGHRGHHHKACVRWRNAHATYWLMRRCGLRNTEVANLRWEWFEIESPERIKLALIRRPYWTPKATSGRVTVHPTLYRELLNVLGPRCEGAEGFVLHGDELDRHESVNHFLNRFVRRYTGSGHKAAYKLRKHRGSEIVTQKGLAAAAKELRSGIGIIYKHYYGMLEDIEPEPF